jgi:anthranilate/para-aminobenzoate synthase component II
MGICLGHQLMARVQGREVSSSASQMHGQAVEILFHNKSYLVQRYNSLAVKIDGSEVNICEYQNGISYQFHPESVGTLQNEIFFKSLLNFIHS